MTTTLEVERHVAASPGRVWAAWTTAEGLAAWWWPHLPDTTYLVDARPNGTYRIESAVAGIGVQGEYLDLDEPRSFSITWVWLAGGVPQPVERVHVELIEEAAGRTLVRVTHHVAGDEAAEASYRQGWVEVLARLDHGEPAPTGGSGGPGTRVGEG